MTDVVTAPVRIPATTISDDVQLTIDSAPYQPVNWDALTVEKRLPEATAAMLMLMVRGGIGEPDDRVDAG